MKHFCMPVLIALPVLAGIVLAAARMRRRTCKLWLMTAVFAVEAAGVVWLALNGADDVTLFRLTDTLVISLSLDRLGKLFALVFSFAWMLVGIFSFRYMTHEKREDLFFSFFLICEGMLLGACFAANLISLYLFYEMVSLLSMPLVLHSLTREAVAAALKYLFYSVGGAFLALFGLFVLSRYCTTLTFTPGGTLDLAALPGKENLVRAAAFCSILGFGVKAGLFPLHAWLPTAHPVAPAPASAVLSGIITKIGVIASIRMIYCITGTQLLAGSWVQQTLLVLSLISVFMGSMMALRETVFKKRLAYSTVSQVSYVLTGVFLMNEQALTGGLLHVVFHASIKVCLFLTAGSIIYHTGKTNVTDYRGLGKQMPLTLWCITFASLALVGIPPFSGFVSKWYLAAGALGSGLGAFTWVIPAVLLISALLTAGYLITITAIGFFPGKDFVVRGKRCDGSVLMWGPIAALALFCLLAGVFSGVLVDLARSVAQSLM